MRPAVRIQRQPVLIAMSFHIISYDAVLFFDDLLIRLVIVSQQVLMSFSGKNLAKSVGMWSQGEYKKGYKKQQHFPLVLVACLVNPAIQPRSTWKILILACPMSDESVSTSK